MARRQLTESARIHIAYFAEIVREGFHGSLQFEVDQEGGIRMVDKTERLNTRQVRAIMDGKKLPLDRVEEKKG